jgi:hypothetical protein
MVTLTASKLARRTTLAACLTLALSLAAVALDIATTEPGRWHLIPRWAESLVLLAPLVLSLGALLFAAVAAQRREPESLRPGRWLPCGLIVFFYVLFFVWSSAHPVQ